MAQSSWCRFWGSGFSKVEGLGLTADILFRLHFKQL